MVTASGTPGGEGNVPGRAILIIRLRGVQNLNPKTKDTLKYMRLNRVNHAVVLPETPTTKGMLQVGKDYVTWGEVDAKTLAQVIAMRGRLVGDKPITDEHIAKGTPFATIDALAEAIVAGKFHYGKVPDVKPIFRLHPARKGLEGIKRSVQIGGALGYRGKNINELLGRMVGAEGMTVGKQKATGADSRATAVRGGA